MVNHLGLVEGEPDTLRGVRPVRGRAAPKPTVETRQGAEMLSHYDAAEGLLTSVILLLAEFLPPKEIDGELRERRHIVSVFKLVQDLLEPATGANKGKSQFQMRIKGRKSGKE